MHGAGRYVRAGRLLFFFCDSSSRSSRGSGGGSLPRGLTARVAGGGGLAGACSFFASRGSGGISHAFFTGIVPFWPFFAAAGFVSSSGDGSSHAGSTSIVLVCLRGRGGAGRLGEELFFAAMRRAYRVYSTRIAITWLQSPVTPFTVARTRKCTVVPGVRPVTVARASFATGRPTHVFPPSRLY
jgi:hypothetical protein